MNIFWLSNDNEESVKFYCDTHVVKIILECGQMLSTALRQNGYNNEGLYKETHANHPVTKWCSESKDNFLFAYNHMKELDKEYRYRKSIRKNVPFESVTSHKSWRLFSMIPRKALIDFPDTKSTQPPQCVPNYCKGDDTVVAYRKYYANEKWPKDWFYYTVRDPPSWLWKYSENHISASPVINRDNPSSKMDLFDVNKSVTR